MESDLVHRTGVRANILIVPTPQTDRASKPRIERIAHCRRSLFRFRLVVDMGMISTDLGNLARRHGPSLHTNYNVACQNEHSSEDDNSVEPMIWGHPPCQQSALRTYSWFSQRFGNAFNQQSSGRMVHAPKFKVLGVGDLNRLN